MRIRRRNPLDLAINGFFFPGIALVRNFNHIVIHGLYRLSGAFSALLNPRELAVQGFLFPTEANFREAYRFAGAVAAFLDPSRLAIEGYYFPNTAIFSAVVRTIAFLVLETVEGSITVIDNGALVYYDDFQRKKSRCLCSGFRILVYHFPICTRSSSYKLRSSSDGASAG